MSQTLKIVIKDAERKSLTEEYVIDPMVDKPLFEMDHPTVKKYLNLLLDQFRGEPEDIIISTKNCKK